MGSSVFPNLPPGEWVIVQFENHDQNHGDSWPYTFADGWLMQGVSMQPLERNEEGNTFAKLALLGSPRSGENVDAFLRSLNDRYKAATHEWKVRVASLKPGEYYPRVHRPVTDIHVWPNPSPATIPPPMDDQLRDELARSAMQIASLTRRFDEICAYIHPDLANWHIYGIESRNLLLLAAMEVEAQCRAILKANSYSATNDRFNTKDFVKLSAPLKLADYAVAFTQFPWIEPISPFFGWNVTNPSKSLDWYDAYNQTKHDREANVAAGNVRNAASALCGGLSLLAAQVGPNEALNLDPSIGQRFRFWRAPSWHISDCYWSYAGQFVPKMLLL